MSGGCLGGTGTDARDACAIGETSRARKGFAVLGAPAQSAAGLASLTSHHAAPIAGPARLVNRPRDVLTG